MAEACCVFHHPSFLTLALSLQLLDVVDRIEDQVETHAYEDLVPIEIKMAIENRICEFPV